MHAQLVRATQNGKNILFRDFQQLTLEIEKKYKPFGEKVRWIVDVITDKENRSHNFVCFHLLLCFAKTNIRSLNISVL